MAEHNMFLPCGADATPSHHPRECATHPFFRMIARRFYRQGHHWPALVVPPIMDQILGNHLQCQIRARGRWCGRILYARLHYPCGLICLNEADFQHFLRSVLMCCSDIRAKPPRPIQKAWTYLSAETYGPCLL